MKEEHKSNIRDLNTRIEDLELQSKLKTDKVIDLQRQLSTKDSELSRMRLDIEKLMKNLKDSALAFSQAQKANEEAVARKTKEVESLIREKKCKGCAICLEDLKDKQHDHLLSDLNDRLMAKSKRVE